MSKPKPAPLPAGTVVGGYQIIKRLAAGGFGVVYLAEDPDRHMVNLSFSYLVPFHPARIQ